MNGPVPVITPTHKESLSPIEIRRLKLTLKSNPNSVHFFVTPSGMSSRKLLSDFPDSSILPKPPEFFTSVNSYNSLMLSRDFYSDYQSHEYILIAQTDAFVVRDIAPLTTMGYPYVGASWNPSFVLTPIGRRIFVNRKFPKCIKSFELQGGNGGLSLRNVSVMLEVLKRGSNLKESKSFLKEDVRRINEDLAISYLCTRFGYKIPERDILNKIFVETNFRETYRYDSVYGFHGLDKQQPELEKELISFYENQFIL